MEIILYWADKNWQKRRGCANNIWLHIYPDTREYKKTISMYCDIGRINVVEVKRKSEIEDMIKYLDGWDYKKK